MVWYLRMFMGVKLLIVLELEEPKLSLFQAELGTRLLQPEAKYRDISPENQSVARQASASTW